MKTLYSLLLVTMLYSTSLFAQQSDEELQKEAQNPLANMIIVPVLNNTNFELGPNGDRTGNLLNIQPVFPFFDGRLITRTIFNIPTNPIYTEESGSKTGFGDILFTAFYTPQSKGFIWGIGPAISFPTGGDDFGSGKWAAGPALVVLAMPGRWVAGFVINNVWSFAGDEDRADVNFMTIQPFINYNFPEFYLTYSPIWSANWEAESGNQWTIPLGMGIGKVMKLGGKLPLNLQASYHYNVVSPEFGPQSQLRLAFSLLFPSF